MADLSTRQNQLWQLLNAHCLRQPMLRICRTDDCYWVCDLVRHAADTGKARTALLEAGFTIADDTSALWKIDLSADDGLYRLPAGEIGLPQKEQLHALYALWRLLRSHPAPIGMQPMPVLRGVMKLTLLAEKERTAHAQRLHAACAALHNRRQPLPYSACGLLARTILKEDEI